jgi:hypothetical protein
MSPLILFAVIAKAFGLPRMPDGTLTELEPYVS